MKTELWYLTLVTALTGLLFLPYVLDRTLAWGLADTVGYPADPKPQSAWARRLMRAHANAVENLVVFATLVLVAQAAGVSNGATATWKETTPVDGSKVGGEASMEGSGET